MTDAELRDLARRARRASIDATDARADLALVRRRIASGDDGTGLGTPASGSPDRSSWLLAAAAVAVFGLVAVGVLALRGDDPTTLRIDSATVPPTEPSVPGEVAPTTSVDDDAAALTPIATTPTSQPSAPPPTAEPSGEQIAIEYTCVKEWFCTQLANTADGILAFDPASNALLLFDAGGTTLTDEIPIRESLADRSPYLISVGPGDVAYFLVTPPDAGDPVADLVAIPTSGPNAGSLLAVASRLDNSGDTDLVPTPGGLAAVGCCGPEFQRPEPGATVYPWLDGDGRPITSDAPHFVLGLRDNSGLTRTEPATGGTATFVVPAVAVGGRGMPRLVATDDGGALAIVFDWVTNRTYGVRFRTNWPEYSFDPTDVVLMPDPYENNQIVLLEPTGSIIVLDGGRLMRRELDEFGTAGWPGSLVDDVTEWSTRAPGLNDYIDANRPEWATDPILLARQLEPGIGPGERFEATYDEATQTLSTISSNFLDDSAFAIQRTTLLDRGTDGLYRFVSSTYGVQCQPGRGHQDFRPEGCV